MKPIINIIAIILFALSTNSCKKTNTQTLPPATTSGANTFGCKVNGVVCSVKGYSNFSGFGSGEGVSINGWFQDSSMSLGAKLLNPNYNFSLNFKFNNIVGTYYTEGNNNYMSEFNDYTNGSASMGNNTFNTTNTHKGKFVITKVDLVNEIIAGTFEMDVINDYGVIVHITDGRFDIKK
jgi:hypothetical protein